MMDELAIQQDDDDNDDYVIPQILHFSARQIYSNSEFECFYVNFVFKVFDEDEKFSVAARAREYTRNVLWDVDSPAKIEAYYQAGEFVSGSGALMDFVCPPEHDISDKKVSGYSVNPEKLLTYIPKFDIYCYKEYVQKNPITVAAFGMLEEMFRGHYPVSRFLDSSTILRTLGVLELFWD